MTYHRGGATIKVTGWSSLFRALFSHLLLVQDEQPVGHAAQLCEEGVDVRVFSHLTVKVDEEIEFGRTFRVDARFNPRDVDVVFPAENDEPI